MKSIDSVYGFTFQNQSITMRVNEGKEKKSPVYIHTHTHTQKKHKIKFHQPIMVIKNQKIKNQTKKIQHHLADNNIC